MEEVLMNACVYAYTLLKIFGEIEASPHPRLVTPYLCRDASMAPGKMVQDLIEALHCLLFHGDGGHIGGQNCIESMEAALQYGRHHHG